MNVSKTFTNTLLALLVLLLPIVVDAQTTQHSTFQGEASNLYLYSVIIPPNISKAPANGTAVFQSTGTSEGVEGSNIIIYTPNANFVGSDSIEVYRWRDVATPATSTFVINVAKSEVIAVDDHITTKVGQAITVFVLDNDTQTNGSLSLQDILVTNNSGAASIDVGGTITYTPPSDFTGTANLSYLACNEVGACDVATLSVSVEEDVPTAETLQLITTKNTAKEVLLALDGFDLATAPTKGFLDDSEDVLKYQPYNDQLGADVFTFQNGDVTKTIEVDILDADDANTFAKDDYIYTAIDKAVEISFLANDDIEAAYENVRIIQQPFYGGLLLSEAQDQVSYQPLPGFSTTNPFTIDRFVYEVTVNGVSEQATVYIYVSDFLPSASTFDLSTTKNIPLLIQYAIPIDYSGFEVVAQGTLGQASFHQNLDTEVYGHHIVGERALLYIPNENTTGTDQFEVRYCVSDSNCKTITINVEVQDIDIPAESICFGSDCVWAGDTNNDGVVNMNDLLTLGMYVGQTGSSRINASEDWYGQYSDQWFASETIVTTVNIDLFGQHIDTNGDGVITAKDTSAISTFYGNYHTITPTSMPNKDLLPIYYGAPDTVPILGPNARLNIPIILGSEYFAAEDIYGITFDINYSPDIFVPGTAEVHFLDDSWLAYGSPVLAMSKEPFDGNLQTGFTRTNGVPSSGYGEIAMFTIVTTVNIDLFRFADEVIEPLSITATIMGSDGITKQLDIDTYSLKLAAATENNNTNPTQLDDESRLLIYPNPSSDVLNLHLNGLDQIVAYEVYSLTGQLIKTVQGATPIPVKTWDNGVYFVKAYTAEGGVLNKKFEVIKH